MKCVINEMFIVLWMLGGFKWVWVLCIYVVFIYVKFRNLKDKLNFFRWNGMGGVDSVLVGGIMWWRWKEVFFTWKLVWIFGNIVRRLVGLIGRSEEEVL